jgi:hypothetical protein
MSAISLPIGVKRILGIFLCVGDHNDMAGETLDDVFAEAAVHAADHCIAERHDERTDKKNRADYETLALWRSRLRAAMMNAILIRRQFFSMLPARFDFA